MPGLDIPYNERATFFVETGDDTGPTDPFDDNYDDTAEESDPWESKIEDVAVRYEPGTGNFARGQTGETVENEPVLIADPMAIGRRVETGRGYERQIDEDDRVELAHTPGRFTILDIREHRFDDYVPEYTELEISQIDA